MTRFMSLVAVVAICLAFTGTIDAHGRGNNGRFVGRSFVPRPFFTGGNFSPYGVGRSFHYGAPTNANLFFARQRAARAAAAGFYDPFFTPVPVYRDRGLFFGINIR